MSASSSPEQEQYYLLKPATTNGAPPTLAAAEGNEWGTMIVRCTPSKLEKEWVFSYIRWCGGQEYSDTVLVWRLDDIAFVPHLHDHAAGFDEGFSPESPEVTPWKVYHIMEVAQRCGKSSVKSFIDDSMDSWVIEDN